MQNPLVPPVAAFILGILAARFLGLSSGEAEWLAVSHAALGALCRLLRLRRLTALALLITVAGVGAWYFLWRQPGPPPVLLAAPQERILIQGCVVEPSHNEGSRARFVLEVIPGARFLASRYGRDPASLPRLAYGERILIEGSARPIRNYGNPGAFDYAAYSARNRTYWYFTSGSSMRLERLPGKCGSAWASALHAMRQRLLERTDRLFGSDPAFAVLLRAMLWGDKSSLPPELRARFRLAGVYHALVVSGLHVGALAIFCLFLVRSIGSEGGWAYLFTLGVIWTYALLVGAQTPSVRAASGLSLFLAARWCFRRARLLNLLAAVAGLFLLYDPGQLFDASFQLSFLAVASIGALAVPLLERTSAPMRAALSALERPDRDMHLEPRQAQFRIELRLLVETVALLLRLPYLWALKLLAGATRLAITIWELFVLTVCIQAGLALSFVYLFHRVSLSALGANVLVVPMLGALVPAGFAAAITGWAPLVAVTQFLLGLMIKVVSMAASYEPEGGVPPPPLWLAAVTAISLILLAASWKRARLRLLAASLSVTALTAVIVHPFPVKVERGTLELTMLDVGQAESLFLALPTGHTAVLDGGGLAGASRSSPSRFDPGEEILAPYLLSRSIRTLDVLILSHAHEDHIGGLFSLLRSFRPVELWTGISATGSTWERLREEAQRRGILVRLLRQGEVFSFGGVSWEVLAPAAAAPSVQPSNNDSLVLRLTFGSHSILLTGDIESRVERELAAGGWLPPANVLKVPHHGSRTSTTPELLASVRPALALISAGAWNSFGFPHPAVLERLHESGARVYRTDLAGAITLRTDGRRISVSTYREQAHSQGLVPLFSPE